MSHRFLRVVQNDTGAVQIEYALIAALVALVAVAAITSVGNDIKAVYEEIARKITVP